MSVDMPYCGRIAPSPTGYLHLGHAHTFWVAYQRCLRANGTLIFRDEDIDPHRCRREFSLAAIEDLAQLGIRWHEGPDLGGPHTPYRQSESLDYFARQLETLARQGVIYPCPHSRKTIAEHPDTTRCPNGELRFPTSLRSEPLENTQRVSRDINWRFRVHDRKIDFDDLACGPMSFQGQVDFGDFLVWRRDGVPAYELAVVADDHRMHITEVVRGQDLLLSTARQLLIYQALQWEPPAFYHAPLVTDEQGQRLAKRSNSLALRTLFDQGLSPAEILHKAQTS